ncbi:hypothetical protein LRAMOSA07854 [Lichtheimia ramosa]|uniref:Coth protein-domain-containing protein n=1 Tax=Lichtheimia ramosa TaxID=688394 RepID=A0A077WD19_9FUNG|nr:hypothetical protein LRAMOSA07854 [Lichtheimia ramosa]
MRTIFCLLVSLLLCHLVSAGDVQYSVIAFPQGSQSVGVSIDGKIHPLDRSKQTPNLFTGAAPSPSKAYQYVLIDGQQNKPESSQRTLKEGTVGTGNEFFGRSQTVYDVPALPQAFNPIYPTLFTNMNRSNEVATVILQTSNTTALDAMLKNPKGDLKDVPIDHMTYIASNEVHTYTGVGFSTSGQSSKEFAKQSYKLKLNKFSPKGAPKDLLFGRTTLKLRAEATDMTMVREKLMLDCLAAAGAATLSGSFVRLYINDQPFGLYLLMDDASTHLIDNILHAGDWQSTATGETVKGNSMNPQQEGNLEYKGDDLSLYPEDTYKLEDKGEDKSIHKNNSLAPLIGFMRDLAALNPQSSEQDWNKLMNPKHTLIHLALNFLSSSWDGLWYQASNYYINQDLKTRQWTIITYDFDETFGNNLENMNLMTVPYQNYARPNSSRPLVEKLLGSPHYKAEFETVLKTIVKRFFKPTVMDARLKAWVQMLHEDIAWDRSLQPHSPGKPDGWVTQDFESGMFKTTKDQVGLLEYITKRSEAVCKQLQFDDKDDVPPLPAYTEGRYMDANGNISDRPNVGNNHGAIAPNGDQSESISALSLSLTSPMTYLTPAASLVFIISSLF